jgi:hypothetical protein
MKAWPEQIGSTFLGNKRRSLKIDKRVSGLLIAAGGKTARSVFPSASSFRDDLVVLGRENRWLACTTLIAVYGELLLCAESGRTIKHAFTPRADRPSQIDAATTIRHLRNSACHPAHVAGGDDGRPHLERLTEHFRVRAIELENVKKLEANPAEFQARWVAEAALRALHQVACAFDERYAP